MASSIPEASQAPLPPSAPERDVDDTACYEKSGDISGMHASSGSSGPRVVTKRAGRQLSDPCDDSEMPVWGGILDSDSPTSVQPRTASAPSTQSQRSLQPRIKSAPSSSSLHSVQPRIESAPSSSSLRSLQPSIESTPSTDSQRSRAKQGLQPLPSTDSARSRIRPKVFIKQPSNVSVGSGNSCSSVSSLMSQVRQDVIAAKSISGTNLGGPSKWGPTSGTQKRPKVRETSFAQPSQSSPRSENDIAESEGASPKCPPFSPTASGGTSPKPFSSIKRSNSFGGRRLSSRPEEPAGGEADEPTSAKPSNLRRSRSTISQMSAVSAADQATELTALASELREQLSAMEGPLSPARRLSLKRQDSKFSQDAMEGQRSPNTNKRFSLKRQGSNVSQDTMTSAASLRSSRGKGTEKSKSHETVADSPHGSPRFPVSPYNTEDSSRSSGLSPKSSRSILFSMSISSMWRNGTLSRCLAWFLLRAVAVLLSVGALLVQVFMREHEFAEIFGYTFGSLATLACVALAVLSGPPFCYSSASRFGSADYDCHSSDEGSASGDQEDPSNILAQIPDLLHTAATGILNMQSQLDEEREVWDDLRDEQERLLRGFNRIIARETSLRKSRATVTVIIVQEAESVRQELEQLCNTLKVKCKPFSNLTTAESALEDCEQSIHSAGSQHGILKHRPGASIRDWRCHQFIEASNEDGHREQTRIVLLDTKCLPQEKPLPPPWQDDRVLLAVTGDAGELNEAAPGLPKAANQTEVREYWKTQGVSMTLQAPFTKDAIRGLIMEAFHMWHREEYLLLENIGHGTWGNVFRVKRLSDGNVLALKMMNLGSMQAKYKEAMEREVQFLRAFRWPTVLFLVDAWVSGPVQCMLLPLLDGGDIAKVIKKKSRVPFDSIFDWYAQTLHGLCYLHWRGVVHADIKPANLLLASDGRLLLIGDLGSALLLPGNGPHPCKRNFARLPYCTPAYASPESLLEEKHFAVSDIWSVASTFYETITLELLLPTSGGDVKKQLESLNFGDVAAGGSANAAGAAVATLRNCKVPGSLVEEILEMWALDPQLRPSAANLLMRTSTSDRLNAVLEETGALTETKEHFKDLGQMILDSENAADRIPPPECFKKPGASDDPGAATSARSGRKRQSATQPRMKFFSNASLKASC